MLRLGTVRIYSSCKECSTDVCRVPMFTFRLIFHELSTVLLCYRASGEGGKDPDLLPEPIEISAVCPKDRYNVQER